MFKITRSLILTLTALLFLSSCVKEISSSADSALERDMLNETIHTQGLEYAAY